MGCCDAIVQVLLFIFNFAFFLSGIAVIAVGSYVTANEDDYVALVGDGVLNVSILLIVIGCLIVVLTFFGCCGAWNKNKCMLYTYSALLCIIFICEFAGGIAAFVYRSDIKEDVEENLNATMTDYIFHNNGGSTDDPTTREWDNMQQIVQCCGAYGYEDWFNYDNHNTIPESCCINELSGCANNIQPDTSPDDASKTIYTSGCIDQAINVLDDNAVIIGGVAIGLAFLEILGIVLACCLANDSK